MSDRSKRRWFQFGIGTILWATTAIALALFGLREHHLRLECQAIAETEPNKAYQVQLEWHNELLKRELARAQEQFPAFSPKPLRGVPTARPDLRNW